MTRPIRRLLVANRGEIARRVFRTARAMGMETVAVYARPDADAPHVCEADRAVALDGTTSVQTYLAMDALLAAATLADADAVHPGYGFLSESAVFAQAVTDAGLVWVGPPPEAIAVMGDKVRALDAMERAGVPTLPRVELGSGTGTALQEAAAAVGYPLLVKASAGGGGKGMRLVATAEGLIEAVDAARREAAAAFGDERLFAERFVPAGRHIEVQVIADAQGRARHLYERECSIQRRHQKVVEESPSPFLAAPARAAMCDAAVAAAEAVDYRGVGTVEFIVDAQQRFHFLEMNTRLQVEHPVTECVTEVDLVREQLLVAQGLPLSFEDVTVRGAAIEVRLYAEDPGAGFLPATGRVRRWREPAAVRVDAGVDDGTEVGLHFDPMLAKLIAHAPTRPEATAMLARALRELQVHGITTNRDFLVGVLEHPAFAAGDTTTDFIERHAPPLRREPSPDELRVAALAAALAGRRSRLAQAPLAPAVAAGWRNLRSAGERTRFRRERDELDVEFVEDGVGGVRATVDGVEVRGLLHAWDGDVLDVELDGLRLRLAVTGHGADWWVQGPDGEVHLLELPRFPPAHRQEPTGALAAPMNGTVVTVTVTAGDRVSAGQPLVVVEAMKMEHTLLAPREAVVTEVRATPGAVIQGGATLVVLEDSAPTEENHDA